MGTEDPEVVSVDLSPVREIADHPTDPADQLEVQPGLKSDVPEDRKAESRQQPYRAVPVEASQPRIGGEE